MKRIFKRVVFCGAGVLLLWIVAAVVQCRRLAQASAAVPKVKIETTEYASVAFVTPADQSFKFGYYNHSPISADGTKMLAHRIPFEKRLPLPTNEVEIGYFDLRDASWHALAKSVAFNWQQGSMLQWLGPDRNDRVIFNDAVSNRFVSRIYSVSNGEKKIVPYPVYGVDPLGKFSISLNFERCFWTRAYSYTTISNDYWNCNVPRKDGVFRVDLETGERRRILAISDIAADDTCHSHWFEHIMINPDASRFVVYHRYGKGSECFGTVAYTADMDGRNIWRHPTSGVTHWGWRNAREYVVFSGNASGAGKSYSVAVDRKGITMQAAVWFYRRMVKPFIPVRIVEKVATRSFYEWSRDQEGVVERWNAGLLGQDGHPSFTKDGRFMLSDTYSDQKNFRYLYIYDTQARKEYLLAKVYSEINLAVWRADLHPRFSLDENKIVIDSSVNGYHQMVLLNVKWDNIRKQ